MIDVFKELGEHFESKSIAKELKEIETEVIKKELMKHMVVRPGKYIIEISPDEWHRIFKMK